MPVGKPLVGVDSGVEDRAHRRRMLELSSDDMPRELRGAVLIAVVAQQITPVRQREHPLVDVHARAWQVGERLRHERRPHPGALLYLSDTLPRRPQLYSAAVG